MTESSNSWKNEVETGHSDGIIVRKLQNHSKILTPSKAPLLHHLAQLSQNVESVSYKLYQEPHPENLSNWHKRWASATVQDSDPRASRGRRPRTSWPVKKSCGISFISNHNSLIKFRLHKQVEKWKMRENGAHLQKNRGLAPHRGVHGLDGRSPNIFLR